MTLTPKRDGFEVRLRYGKGKRDRFLLATTDKDIAAEREPRIEAMARKLAAAGDGPRALLLLREAAAAAGDAKRFAAVERVVNKLVAEAGVVPPTAPASGPSTFRDVVELWTSGKLREQYPDVVRPKTDAGRKIDLNTLAVFLPALGGLAMVDITDEDIVKAKAAIPKGIDPDTRRIYLVRLRTAFRYAKRPLKLITHVPVELDELPPLKKRNLFWFMYPEEDAMLAACTKIPLCFRVLYAWLNRNGTRITETLKLTHDHLDLKRGRVRLEAEWTKTKRARFWDLEHDVHLAMRAWFEADGKPKGTDRVFHSTRGKTVHGVTIRDRFLSDLRLAGVDREEIFVTTPGSRRLRLYDTRATFCTMARRRGMPDSWITDRSGHDDPGQLKKYVRFMRHADEQGLAKWFAPMHEAIPELGEIVRRVGQGWANTRREPLKQAIPYQASHSMAESLSGETQREIGAKQASITPETLPGTTSGPASFQGVGQSGPGQAEVGPGPTDEATLALLRIEEGLQRDLSVLIAAGRYELADKVMAELRERRLQRSAPAVTSLDARRKRKNGDEP